jgi:GWxTD domain-containing protein
MSDPSIPRATRRGSRPSRLTWLLSAVLLLVATGPAVAQTAFEPEFDLDLTVVRAERGDDSRLDLYTAVPHASLRYLARDDGFEGTYTITAEAYRVGPDGRDLGLAQSKIWERRVTLDAYEKTQDDETFDRATQAFTLVPGRYRLEVSLEDGASRRTFTHERDVDVRDLSGAIALSDVLVLDQYDASAGTVRPAAAGTIGSDQERFTLFYELYADRARDVEVAYEIREVLPAEDRHRREPMFEERVDLREAPGPYTDVVFSESETLALAPGRTPAARTLPTEDFPAGQYAITVTLREPGTGTTLGETERPLLVRWAGLDAQIRDVDAAIAQLRYIAKDRDLNAIRSAATHDERIARFQAFWDKRDPTPGTRRNERMEEYYFRVSSANERYGRLNFRGWDTDRGEVFIRFGEPDFVETHTFNYAADPYEVWYYNRIGRRFIFVDDKGFGDYQLLVPIWDERTRM